MTVRIKRVDLLPVCVNSGDAIFICIEEFEETGTDGSGQTTLKKTCYLVDGSKGGGGTDPQQQSTSQSTSTTEQPIKVEGIRNTDYSKLIGVYDALATAGYTLKGIIVTHPDWDHYGGITYLLNNRPCIRCPVLITNEFWKKIRDIESYTQNVQLSVKKEIEHETQELASIAKGTNPDNLVSFIEETIAMLTEMKKKLKPKSRYAFQNFKECLEAKRKYLSATRPRSEVLSWYFPSFLNFHPCSSHLVLYVPPEDIDEHNRHISMPRETTQNDSTLVDRDNTNATSIITTITDPKSDDKPALAEHNRHISMPRQTTQNDSTLVDRDNTNATSIITTITDPKSDDDKLALACLTGDAVLKTEPQQRPVTQPAVLFQVPHHGSSTSSSETLYNEKATNCEMYLISSGAHGKYKFPHKQVLEALAKRPEPNNSRKIIVTNGRWLEGKKMMHADGVPSIYYWDEHVYQDENNVLITQPFLTLPIYELADSGLNKAESVFPITQENNLIEWSITGYKGLALSYVSTTKMEEMTIQINDSDPSKVRHYSVINGIPSPTSPCNWKKNNLVIVLLLWANSDKYLNTIQFLRGADPSKTTDKDNTQFIMYRCSEELPWKVKYAVSSEEPLWSALYHDIETQHEKPMIVTGSFNTTAVAVQQ